MFCPKCGRVLPYGAFFCDLCGANLTHLYSREQIKIPEILPHLDKSRCKFCGRELWQTARYCHFCGTFNPPQQK